MKKQNIEKRLAFDKASIVELNSNELNIINGGTSATSSWECAVIVSGAIYGAGVEVGHWISKQIK